MGAQERPCSDVPRGQRDRRWPVLAGEQDRVARLAMIGRHRDAGPRPVGGNQPPHRTRPDQRLVHQGDHRCFGADRDRAEAGGQRGPHASTPVRVVHGDHAEQLDDRRPQDRHHRGRAAFTQQRDAPVDQPHTDQLHQGLGVAEPPALPRGEQHSRDTCLHGHQA